MRAIYIILLLVFALFPSSGKASFDSGKNGKLIPYRALYDTYLSHKKGGTDIHNISGKMFYEWKISCDAWISTYRHNVFYEYVSAPAIRLTSDFSTYESFDGKNFNFNLQRRQNGMLLEEIRGSANLEGEKDANRAVYSIPEDLVFNLPEGTLFPTAHTLAFLDKVKAGETTYKATVFDGSDDQGPVNISSFVMSELSGKDLIVEESEYIDNNLINSKAWSIRLAFFPLSSFESVSDYEMSIIFHENGIISSIKIDYDDFSITQKLIALEALDNLCLADIKEE